MEDFDDDEESEEDDYYNDKDEEDDDLFEDEPDNEDDLFKDDFAIDEEDEGIPLKMMTTLLFN